MEELNPTLLYFGIMNPYKYSKLIIGHLSRLQLVTIKIT